MRSLEADTTAGYRPALAEVVAFAAGYGPVGCSRVRALMMVDSS
jgi:hypothetical protein